MKNYVSIIITTFLFSCFTPSEDINNEILESNEKNKTKIDTVINSYSEKYKEVHDTSFIVLNHYHTGFAYDMKYASADNFLKKSVYSCSDCMIRKEVANDLIKANEHLITLGYRLKLYDCYRPLDVQKKMWAIYPDGRYVANPYKSGSIHNRGGAVDVTLVDVTGKELDMGTPFDHFGKEAHQNYTELSDTILSNRKLLRESMKQFGFKPITTEWWHYNFSNAKKYSLSNFKSDCN